MELVCSKCDRAFDASDVHGGNPQCLILERGKSVRFLAPPGDHRRDFLLQALRYQLRQRRR